MKAIIMALIGGLLIGFCIGYTVANHCKPPPKYRAHGYMVIDRYHVQLPSGKIIYYDWKKRKLLTTLFSNPLEKDTKSKKRERLNKLRDEN